MNALIPTWRLQWAQKDDMAAWSRGGVPYMTGERLERLVNEAFDKGFAQGELQGRANLRTAIESGEVPPIEPRP